MSVLGRGWFNVGELTEALAATQSNISHHLKTLSSAELITQKKQGTWSYYTIALESEHPLAHSIASNFMQFSEQFPLSVPNEFIEDRNRLRAVQSKRRDTTRAFFESVASDWPQLRLKAIGSEDFVPIVQKHVEPTLSFVELGCGAGVILKELLPRDGTTIGVDNSPAMLEVAKEELLSKGVDLRLGDLEHLPLSDESADVALAHMVLHHVVTPVEALRDARRILKPGGKLVVIDLCTHTDEVMREQFADVWLGFEKQEFVGWCKEAGFCKVESESLGQNDQAFLVTAYK